MKLETIELAKAKAEARFYKDAYLKEREECLSYLIDLLKTKRELVLALQEQLERIERKRYRNGPQGRGNIEQTDDDSSGDSASADGDESARPRKLHASVSDHAVQEERGGVDQETRTDRGEEEQTS